MCYKKLEGHAGHRLAMSGDEISAMEIDTKDLLELDNLIKLLSTCRRRQEQEAASALQLMFKFVRLDRRPTSSRAISPSRA